MLSQEQLRGNREKQRPVKLVEVVADKAQGRLSSRQWLLSSWPAPGLAEEEEKCKENAIPCGLWAQIYSLCLRGVSDSDPWISHSCWQEGPPQRKEMLHQSTFSGSHVTCDELFHLVYQSKGDPATVCGHLTIHQEYTQGLLWAT